MIEGECASDDEGWGSQSAQHWRVKLSYIVDLLQLLVWPSAGFAVALEAKVGHDLRHMHNAIPLAGQPEEELVVHGPLQVLIYAVTFVEDAAAEESARRCDVRHSMMQQNEITEFDFPSNSKDLSAFIHPGVIAIDDIDFRIILKNLRYAIEATRTIAVI